MLSIARSSEEFHGIRWKLGRRSSYENRVRLLAAQRWRGVSTSGLGKRIQVRRKVSFRLTTVIRDLQLERPLRSATAIERATARMPAAPWAVLELTRSSVTMRHPLSVVVFLFAGGVLSGNREVLQLDCLGIEDGNR